MPRRLAPLFALLAGAVVLAAPVPKPAPADPLKGNVVDGLTLTLEHLSEPTEVDGKAVYTPRRSVLPARVTLTNTRSTIREVEEIKFDSPQVTLEQAADLHIVLHGADGSIWSDCLRPPYIPGKGDKFGGPPPPVSALELNAKGTWASKVGLFYDEFNTLYDKAGRKPYAVTYVSERLKLRSNTVFVNGEFDLPKDFDPFADAKAFSQAEWKKERERQEKVKAELEEALKRRNEESEPRK